MQLILYSLYVTNCGDFSIYIIPGIIRAMYGLLLEDWKGTFAITLPLSKDLAAADNGAHEQAATCISLSKPRLNTWGGLTYRLFVHHLNQLFMKTQNVNEIVSDLPEMILVAGPVMLSSAISFTCLW